MSLSQISSLIQYIGECEDQGELEQVCDKLARQGRELTQESSRLECLCYEAMVRQDRLRDPVAAGNILEQALKIVNNNSHIKVEVLARLAMNRFVQHQYKQSLEYHRKALEVANRLNVDVKDLIMGIYTKQRNIFEEEENSGQSYGLLSVLCEVNEEKEKAYELEAEAGRCFEKNHKGERRKFSNFRVAKLQKKKLPQDLTYDMKQDFQQRNQTIKQLFSFYDTLQNPQPNLQTQKSQIIQRLTSILNRYRSSRYPAQLQKVQKLQAFLQKLSSQQLPMIMMNSSQLLPVSVSFPPSIPIPRLNIPSKEDKLLKSRQQFAATTSRIASNEPWEGSDLIKVNYQSEGEDRRYFYMVEGKDKLYYCSKKNKKSQDNQYYSLKGLLGLKRGKMTQTLRRKDNTGKDQSLCFSLEFKQRTRDFCAIQKYDFAMWIDKLTRYLKSSTTSKPKSNMHLTQSVIKQQSGSKPQSGTLLMSRKY